MTRVGRCSRSTSQAVVADLPVPVAPSSTTSFSPPSTRRASDSMAAGSSPEGWKSLMTWKGATRRSRSVVGLTRSPYVVRPTGLGARPAADPDGRPGAGAAGDGDPHRPRHRPVQPVAAPQQARGQDVAVGSAHGDPYDE